MRSVTGKNGDRSKTPTRLSSAPLRKPATAIDVAELAGVSRSAVSRTFTEGASVSPATRERVMEAAQALKYRPNQFARALMTNRSSIVGVAVSALDNQFYPQVIQSLSDQLATVGYRILLFVTHGDTELDPMLNELLRYKVDALILASSSLSSKLAEECRETGVPVIMFNNIDPASPVPSIASDNKYGGGTVAAYLKAAGHRRFGYISGVDESSASREREAGFGAVLKALDAATPARANGNYTFEDAYKATQSLLAHKKPPDAIFCANDHMAFAALQAARSEFGMEPGRDISIVGFDNVRISSWPAFALTTYSQPVEQMVLRAVELINAALNGRDLDSQHEIVAGELIVRSSARRPASGVVRGASGDSVWRPDSKTGKLLARIS